MRDLNPRGSSEKHCVSSSYSLCNLDYAIQYYGHRAKLRIIGREHELEPLNRRALEIAKSVAMDTGTLMAGNICNSTVYDAANPKAQDTVREMFKVRSTL